MTYDEWIRNVLQRPFESGVQGLGLATSTAATLALSFACFGERFFALLPPGDYPRILLALPFLLVAGVAFFALSPLFYGWYCASAPPPTRVLVPARRRPAASDTSGPG
jgi:hypothetical protein